MSQPFDNAADALKFILGGNATVTLVGNQKRYTFKVSVPTPSDARGSGRDQPHFVGVLTGSDNEADYQYIGFVTDNIRIAGKKLIAGNKGNPNHPAFGAFQWTLGQLLAGKIPAPLEVWHEGRCGRCGRKLTVPSSIATGFGPECASKL